MKQSMCLQELAAELERQNEAKRDYLADTRSLNVYAGGRDEPTTLEVDGHGEYVMSEHAQRQLAARLRVPWRYWRRLQDGGHGDLLTGQLNALMRREPESRLVRCLDENVRAVLSNRYRRLDNHRVATRILPVLADQEIDLKASSFHVDQSRLWIKLVFPKIEGEVREGDVVRGGVMLKNAEDGSARLTISPLVFRLVCANGLVSTEKVHTFARTHVGAALQVDGRVGVLFRDSTVSATEEAIWSQVEDIARSVATADVFNDILGRLRETTERRITGSPIAAVEVLAKKVGLTETEAGGVLRHLVEGGDLSQWGVTNAITALAQEQADFARSSEMEVIGGQVVSFSPRVWNEIATAA